MTGLQMAEKIVKEMEALMDNNKVVTSYEALEVYFKMIRIAKDNLVAEIMGRNS